MEIEEKKTSTPRGKGSTSQGGDSTFAYMVIFPNPIKGNSIYAKGGVEVVDPKKQGKVKLETGIDKHVHFIKIGLQAELGMRVSDYNTHTPAMWFRHLEFVKQNPHKEKIETLKRVRESPEVFKYDTPVGESDSSAIYLQKTLLEPFKHKELHAKEWFVLEGCDDELQELCLCLDDKERGNPQMKDVIVKKEQGKKPQTEEGQVNTFDNENTFITLMASYRKVFPIDVKRVFNQV